MQFEWDPKKADANQRKHGVTFDEGATVFGDPLALTFLDSDHSDIEKRYITFGLSTNKRFLVVAHADHGDLTRIICVRLMTGKERKSYEEGQVG